ncbi:hypothetical protein GCM10017771_91980 [Streptomyces capitiformicae]|uniref:Uncharacterized protein n=1 Tax=Streptomyces capitiformicae TaxID=2014920 RepID=A0A918ZSS3_9ACTN|nr:hypothetical protein GCM10017771_91980 [Streptomyces capitiformicae]
MRISSQELSQAAAGSRVLGGLVVPTTIGSASSEASEENTPHPATMAMDAIAARDGRYRFRLNTCMLLEMPYASGRTIPQAPPVAPARLAVPKGLSGGPGLGRGVWHAHLRIPAAIA